MAKKLLLFTVGRDLVAAKDYEAAERIARGLRAKRERAEARAVERAKRKQVERVALRLVAALVRAVEYFDAQAQAPDDHYRAFIAPRRKQARAALKAAGVELRADLSMTGPEVKG